MSFYWQTADYYYYYYFAIWGIEIDQFEKDPNSLMQVIYNEDDVFRTRNDGF